MSTGNTNLSTGNTNFDSSITLQITPVLEHDEDEDSGADLGPLNPLSHPVQPRAPSQPLVPPRPIKPATTVIVEEANNNRLGPAPTGEFTLWLTIDRNLRVPLTLTAQEQQNAAAADQAIRNALGSGAIGEGADPETIKWNYNFTLNHESLVYWVNGIEQPPLALNIQHPAPVQARVDAIKRALKTLEDIHAAKKGGPLTKHTWKEGTLAVSSGYMGGSAVKVLSHKKTFREGAELARDHLTRLRENPNPDVINAAMEKYDVLRYRIKRYIEAVERIEITEYATTITELQNTQPRSPVQEDRLQQLRRDLQAKEAERDQLNAFLQSVEDSDGYAITMALHYKRQLEGLGGVSAQNLATLVNQISRDLSATRQDIHDNRGLIERIKSKFSAAVDTSRDREYATVIAGLVLTLQVDELCPTREFPTDAPERGKRKAQFLMADLFQGLTPPSGIDFHLVSLMNIPTLLTRKQISSVLNVSPAVAARISGNLVQDHNDDLPAARQALQAEQEAASIPARISSFLSFGGADG